jgi:hypothetical protein
MKKPVKKFGGGLINSGLLAGVMRKAAPQIKKAVEKAEGQKESTPGVMAAPRTLVGRVATAAAEAAKNAPASSARSPGRALFGLDLAQLEAEAAKNAPVSSARPQGRGIVGRVAQATGTAAQRVKLPGLKKGGAVTKKAIKKTARKK